MAKRTWHAEEAIWEMAKSHEWQPKPSDPWNPQRRCEVCGQRGFWNCCCDDTVPGICSEAKCTSDQRAAKVQADITMFHPNNNSWTCDPSVPPVSTDCQEIDGTYILDFLGGIDCRWGIDDRLCPNSVFGRQRVVFRFFGNGAVCHYGKTESVRTLECTTSNFGFPIDCTDFSGTLTEQVIHAGFPTFNPACNPWTNFLTGLNNYPTAEIAIQTL